MTEACQKPACQAQEFVDFHRAPPAPCVRRRAAPLPRLPPGSPAPARGVARISLAHNRLRDHTGHQTYLYRPVAVGGIAAAHRAGARGMTLVVVDTTAVSATSAATPWRPTSSIPTDTAMPPCSPRKSAANSTPGRRRCAELPRAGDHAALMSRWKTHRLPRLGRRHRRGNEYGGALLPQLITRANRYDCASFMPMTHCSARPSIWRQNVVAPGNTATFTPPIPSRSKSSNRRCIPRLPAIARDGRAKLGRDALWPDCLDDWLAACHATQIGPTAVMLKYGIDNWTALHQDRHGELVFPLQVVINLSRPDADYTGGEFDAACPDTAWR